MRRVASVSAGFAWAGAVCLGFAWSSLSLGAVQRGRPATNVPPSPAPVMPTATPSAAFPERSPLASLSSANKDDERCAVVLRWLETGPGPEDRPTPGYRRALPGQAIRVFRDEPMTAVFGAPYQALDPNRRRELHEKVFARCLKSQPQWFAPYAELVREAFGGEPGAFDASNIARYLRRVDEQVAWARAALAAARAGANSIQAFDELTARRQAVASDLPLLTEGEQAFIGRALAERQTALAPALVDGWFRDVERTERGVAGAVAVQRGYDGLRRIVESLDAAAQAAASARYRRLTDGLVAEDLEAQLTRLRAIPATLSGLSQLTAWKSAFDALFAGVDGLSGVSAASREYATVRAERVAAVLAVWEQQVAALPLEAGAIAAKRRELDVAFAGRGRASPDLAAFDAPIRALEDRLREVMAADQQRERETRAAAAATAAAHAPAPSAAAAGTKTSAAWTSAAGAVGSRPFTAAQLTNEKVLRAFHDGNFAAIDFNREDATFSTLFRGYLNAYAAECAASLPANRVEMTVPRCDTWSVWSNGNSTCLHEHPEPTGLWADPLLYEASRDTDARLAADSLRQVGRMLQGGNPLGAAMDMVAASQAMQEDLRELVRMNACNGPGLKRFGENLRLFSRNRPGLSDGPVAVSAVTVPVAGLPFRDQDYARLVEDLVGVQSATWVMNRYRRGSIVGVTVESRDAAGRPERLRAGYTYQSGDRAARGTVSVTFTDGLPVCLFFFDAPNTCRTADRKVAASYASGGYEK